MIDCNRSLCRGALCALALLPAAVLGACSATARFDVSGNDAEPKPAGAAHSAPQPQPQSQPPQAQPLPNYLPPQPSPPPAAVAAADPDFALPPSDTRPRDTPGWSARRPDDAAAPDARVHVVRQGDTLTAIAGLHGVTVPMLYTANGLLNDRLTPGQHIIIPATR